MCNLSLLRLHLCWQLLFGEAGPGLEAMVDPTVPPSDKPEEGGRGEDGSRSSCCAGPCRSIPNRATQGHPPTLHSLGENFSPPAAPQLRHHLAEVLWDVSVCRNLVLTCQEKY